MAHSIIHAPPRITHSWPSFYGDKLKMIDADASVSAASRDALPHLTHHPVDGGVGGSIYVLVVPASGHPPPQQQQVVQVQG